MPRLMSGSCPTCVNEPVPGAGAALAVDPGREPPPSSSATAGAATAVTHQQRRAG